MLRTLSKKRPFSKRAGNPWGLTVLLIAGLALLSCDNEETGVPYIERFNTHDAGKQIDTKVSTEGGTLDTIHDSLKDGPGADVPARDLISDGPSTDQRNDVPATDGTLADGPYQIDGPLSDAPNLADSFFDAPFIMDAAQDMPNLGDGTFEAAAPDAARADLFTGDGVPNYDSVVGLSDSGQMLCMTAIGPEVCHCNDGVDNDADGKIDYPDDPGCLGLWDHNELDGTTQCTDSQDNDNDILIDDHDPECTGPLDNDESTFGTGIPGDNVDCKQDCFFDGDSGGGQDGCLWNLRCDPLNPGQYLPKTCEYDSSMAVDPKKCPPNQTQECLDFCLPLTPNGCDCFGCCKLFHNGASNIVLLRDTCTPADLNDPTKCPPCTQVQDCLNTCEPCEVCLGKPSPEPWCFPHAVDAGVPPNDAGVIWPYDASWPYDGAPPTGDAGLPSACPPGVVYCGPGGVASCASGFYCLTGCCKSYDAP